MCSTLRIRDIGICTQNSIKHGNNRQTIAAANGCPQSQNCVQLLVGLQCGVQWSREREEERDRQGEGEGDCRPQGRSRTVSYLCGCWKNILAVYTALAMFGDMFGNFAEGERQGGTRKEDVRGRSKRGRERGNYTERRGAESALIERRLLSPAREFSFKFSTLDCGFHF